MHVGEIQLDRCFGFDARVDTGLAQRLEIGLGIGLRQVAFERYRAPGEQALDGCDIAFEQIGEIELCRGDVDTGQQGTFEYDLETIFAHVRSILVARG
ncbi:hypothetical protein D9M72_537670 [compost metagenome]